MGGSGRRFCVEALESRRLASASLVAVVGTKLAAERQSLYTGDGLSATTYSGVLAYVDTDNVLNIRGTVGNDTITIRKLSDGDIRIDTTTKTYAAQVGTSSAVDGDTLLSTVKHVYDLSSTAFSAIRIDGGSGDDTVYVKGLSYNPKAFAVETSTVQQYEAADDATPSDSIRSGKYGSSSNWAKIASEQLTEANNSHAATVFFGDSHAARFATVGKSSWAAKFSTALNLGIAGDTTRQMITRVEDGLFDQLKPETLIVSVGTNNFNDPTTGGTDAQIYRGVLKLVHLLKERLPDTNIILIGLGPRNDAGITDRILTLNAHLAKGADANGYTFLSTYDRLTGSDASTLIDSTGHYTKKGYQVLAAMLEELMAGM